ncbi:MAG: hypothetical protein KDC83_07510 [Flavobacteriales bacterium]|nr:hypothetical protein [Flavobacteriales bacterium]
MDDNGLRLIWDPNKILGVSELRALINSRENAIRTTDHFINTYYGAASEKRLNKICRNFPKGTSEMVMHLADLHTDDELATVPMGVDPSYFNKRMQELSTLTHSGRFDGLMNEFNINWGSW